MRTAMSFDRDTVLETLSKSMDSVIEEDLDPTAVWCSFADYVVECYRNYAFFFIPHVPGEAYFSWNISAFLADITPPALLVKEFTLLADRYRGSLESMARNLADRGYVLDDAEASLLEGDRFLPTILFRSKPRGLYPEPNIS